jgi:hypothetical protein
MDGLKRHRMNGGVTTIDMSGGPRNRTAVATQTDDFKKRIRTYLSGVAPCLHAQYAG